jgi:hypothetical protein
MASSFPGAIDNFTDPLSNSPLNSPSHSGQHSDLNDAVEKIETYMGLVKVIPTGVSSAGGTAATLAANGTVNVGTGNTSVTVSGVFSSLYDNYRVIVSGGVANTSLYIAMTLGASAVNYFGSLYGCSYVTGAAIGIGTNNQASWPHVGLGTTGYTILDCDLFGPNLARNTVITAKWSFNLASTGYSTFTGEHVVASQHTAFTITPTGGNITGGTIRVYGYRN